MLTVTVVGKEQVIARFSSMKGKIHNKLLKVIYTLALQLEAHVKQDKLQGQVLNHRTGKLQSSIQNDVKETGSSITGRVYSNSSVNYAAIHEYGFHGEEQVRSHIRDTVFGRKVDPFTVPAFTRMMNMPERSFMRSSLSDFRDKIIGDMSEAVSEAVMS